MSNSTQTQRVLAIIMIAVLAWGTFHAVGAYYFNHYWARPAMVLLCVGAFLGWWLWLLKRKSVRDQRDEIDA